MFSAELLYFIPNAQVYAYGGSALQAALLRLFVRCEAVLPGLWVGTLTRESIIGAPHPVAAVSHAPWSASSAAHAAAAGLHCLESGLRCALRTPAAIADLRCVLVPLPSCLHPEEQKASRS